MSKKPIPNKSNAGSLKAIKKATDFSSTLYRNLERAQQGFDDFEKNMIALSSSMPFLKIAARALLLKTIYNDNKNPLLPISALNDHMKAGCDHPIWVDAYLKSFASGVIGHSYDNLKIHSDGTKPSYHGQETFRRSIGFRSEGDHVKFHAIHRDIDITEYVRDKIKSQKDKGRSTFTVLRFEQDAAGVHAVSLGTVKAARKKYGKYLDYLKIPAKELLREYSKKP